MTAAPAKAAVDPRMVRTLCFEDLHVGMRETLMKSVMETDVVGFANVSGDDNPIHLCDTYASGTRFGQRIAHGLYTASLISAVLGTRLPGAGAVYRSQTLNFHAPVKIGDVVDGHRRGDRTGAERPPGAAALRGAGGQCAGARRRGDRLGAGAAERGRQA